MTSMNQTILAIGASGKYAGLVVPELAKRGARVRGLVRTAAQSDSVLKNGASEVVVGDLTDRASLNKALKGVESVFYIAPAFIPDEVKVGTDMVEAAKQAGVRRFVFSSVIDPVISALINHSAKAPVEEAVIESGMEYALLQPAMFFQSFARSWSEVIESGTYGEPWSEETRFTRVDYRDVAEVAALALMEDRLLYGTYQLCAAGNLNRKEVVTLMSEVMGRNLESVRLSPPPNPSLSLGAAKPASPMQLIFNWYDHHALVGNALTLRAILGREPRTLRTYFEEINAGHQSVAGK